MGGGGSAQILTLQISLQGSVVSTFPCSSAPVMGLELQSPHVLVPASSTGGTFPLSLTSHNYLFFALGAWDT